MPPSQSYDERYIRGVAASIELAAELILRERLPKEKEQHVLWNNALTSVSSANRTYRELTAFVLSKPDSFFEPLLTFVQEAIDNMPEGRRFARDIFGPKSEEMAMNADILSSLREGAHHEFWCHRPDVGEWIAGVVRDVFAIIDRNSLFSVSNGKDLLHHLVALRFVYGELLAAMTPYLTPTDKTPSEEYCTFSSAAVQQIRGALLLETARQILETPSLHRHIPELLTHAIAASERNIRLMAVSAISQLDLTLRKLTLFKSHQSEVLDCVVQAALWESFVDHALPHLSEFARQHPPLTSAPNFFIPGQLAFVFAPQESGDAHIAGAFDNHSGCRFLTASSKDFEGSWYQISGVGMPERFAFAASDSVGVRMDAHGSLFTSWEERLAPRRDNEALEESRQIATRCFSFVESHLADLWHRDPSLLEMMSEDEPTVLLFDGPRIFVLGTSIGENKVRTEFFANADSVVGHDVFNRSGLVCEHPEFWLIRPITSLAEAPSDVPAESLPHEELSRRELRRDFRAAISRSGQMNYRTFVASLSHWDVVETTDGRGGHGSLKRLHDGLELRTGTWGALRNPEKAIEFARMYEILETLKIPIQEYTTFLLRERL